MEGVSGGEERLGHFFIFLLGPLSLVLLPPKTFIVVALHLEELFEVDLAVDFSL